jgi:hypothetical protein
MGDKETRTVLDTTGVAVESTRLLHVEDLVCGDIPELLGRSARPPNLDRRRAGFLAQSEMTRRSLDDRNPTLTVT